jgi:hypothetical protein
LELWIAGLVGGFDVIGLRFCSGLAGWPQLASPKLHTHGFATAGNPSSAAGAPVSKRRFQTPLLMPAHLLSIPFRGSGGGAGKDFLPLAMPVRLLEFILLLLLQLLLLHSLLPSCLVQRYA